MKTKMETAVQTHSFEKRTESNIYRSIADIFSHIKIAKKKEGLHKLHEIVYLEKPIKLKTKLNERQIRDIMKEGKDYYLRFGKNPYFVLDKHSKRFDLADYSSIKELLTKHNRNGEYVEVNLNVELTDNKSENAFKQLADVLIECYSINPYSF